jgi:hypothetical protein
MYLLSRGVAMNDIEPRDSERKLELANTELQVQYDQLMQTLRMTPVLRDRRSGSLWSTMIPQNVPSYATYGAYEPPL